MLAFMIGPRHLLAGVVAAATMLAVGATLTVRSAGADVTPRTVSGQIRIDEGAPAGTVTVRVTYDDLAEARPPARIDVALVGYGADESVTVVRRRTDRGGVATFGDLDTTGAVSYFVLAQVPRHGRADRLGSPPFAGGPTGLRLVLSAAARASTAAPIDDLLSASDGARPAVPRGQVRVTAFGVPAVDMPLTLVDAGTGKVVARGVMPDKELTLKLAPRPGQILYAEAIAHGRHYRSAPVMVVADRGAPLSFISMPRVMANFHFVGDADDGSLRVSGDYELANYSWSPYAKDLPLTIPLPRGASDAHVFDADDLDGDSDLASGGAFVVTRPLPAGGRRFRVAFDLPAAGATIPLSLDLPFGAFDSSVRVVHEGVTLDAPPGLAVTTVTADATPYLAVDDITLVPPTPLELTIHPRTLTPVEAAVASACRPLRPDRTPLRGQRAPALALLQVDGALLDLASLRGKPVLVNFMATWDGLSPRERPQLAALARRAGDLAILLVASDRDPAAVSAAVGPRAPFRVVLDPPSGDTSEIGAVTARWGTRLLPESYLVDRKGVVRAYFANARDWTTPDAQACVAAVAAIR